MQGGHGTLSPCGVLLTSGRVQVCTEVSLPGASNQTGASLEPVSLLNLSPKILWLLGLTALKITIQNS